jgi:hypothetical protein
VSDSPADEGSRVVRGPVGEDRPQASDGGALRRAEFLVVCIQLVAPEHQVHERGMRQPESHVCAAERRQSSIVRDVGARLIERFSQGTEAVSGHRGEQTGAIAEEVPRRGVGEAGAARDGAHADRRRPSIREFGPRRREQAIAGVCGVFGGHRIILGGVLDTVKPHVPLSTNIRLTPSSTPTKGLP